MRKPDLVLIEGYGTNSIILKGLIDFLDDYFVVHYFDLPGFIQEVEPLEKVTIQNYVRYVQEQIDQLALETYYIAGVSFGFLLANKAAADKRCEGILAIEPYINAQHLNFSTKKMLSTKIAVKTVTNLKLYEKIWHSKYFKKTLIKRGYPSNMITEILKDMNSREYFETGKLLVTFKEPPTFWNKPYTLIVNLTDKVINAKKVLKTFKKHAKQLNVIYTNAAHYPEKLDRSYFDTYIGKDEIAAIPLFFETYKNSKKKHFSEVKHQNPSEAPTPEKEAIQEVIQDTIQESANITTQQTEAIND